MLLGLTTSRFLAVVLPWQNLKMTEVQAKLVCFGAWLGYLKSYHFYPVLITTANLNCLSH
uniref:Uncharacterized protein n=1 Tax=Schistosoma haematobium TaxID=6185 RepID=A0A095BXD1_SCHHA